MISKDNHVKFAHFVWLAIGEEEKQCPGLQVNVYCCNIFFFRSVCNKTVIKFGFCDIQSYQPQPLAPADNSYLDLNYSG